jgi:hypothetical protein
LYLTPLTLLHGIEAIDTLRAFLSFQLVLIEPLDSKNRSKHAKLKKIGANVQLQLKTRAVLQLTQNSIGLPFFHPS